MAETGREVAPAPILAEAVSRTRGGTRAKTLFRKGEAAGRAPESEAPITRVIRP